MRLFSKIRGYFLTGIMVAAPLYITYYIISWLIRIFDENVKSILPDYYNPNTYLSYPLPGIGLVLSVIFLTLLGALTANFLGKKIISYGENLLGRMPVVRNLYGISKQIFETILSQNSATFKQVGIIEFPGAGMHSLVFLTNVIHGQIKEAISESGDELVSVFLPTAPNPTSGFLIFVPRKSIRLLRMTPEQAMKAIISAGVIIADSEAEKTLKVR